mgnify:FL=1
MRNGFGWDLPPGVRHSDIPGERPEDYAFDRFLDTEEYSAVADEGDDAIERAFAAWQEAQIDMAGLDDDGGD